MVLIWFLYIVLVRSVIFPCYNPGLCIPLLHTQSFLCTGFDIHILLSCIFDDFVESFGHFCVDRLHHRRCHRGLLIPLYNCDRENELLLQQRVVHPGIQIQRRREMGKCCSPLLVLLFLRRLKSVEVRAYDACLQNFNTVFIQKKFDLPQNF